jgi:hypothetical protein
MNILTHSNFDKFNVYGLKEICRYNRDIFMNYNSLMRDDLCKYVLSKINEGSEILIPPFIENNNNCFIKYKLKQVI